MRKNGFTLIELILVILLISILSLIGLNIFSFDKVDNEPDEKTTLDQVLASYYHLLYKNNNLRFNKDRSDTLFYCIKYENLVKEGYLEEDDVPVDANGKPYEYAYVQNSHKDMKYTNIFEEQVDSLCSAVKINVSSIENDSSGIGDDDLTSSNEVDKYKFSQTITQVDVDKYEVASHFEMKVLYEIETTVFRPIYTVIVIDRSGSMSGSRMSSANSAATSLTAQLAAINAQNAGSTDINRPIFCTSVVGFASSASIYSRYTDRSIPVSMGASGGTNFSAALSQAQSIISNKASNTESGICSDPQNLENAKNFVLFLSDGYGESYGGGGSSKSITENLKNNYDTSFFTISYGVSDNDNLKCIASRYYRDYETPEPNDYRLCSTSADGSNISSYNSCSTGMSSRKCVYYFEATSSSQLTDLFSLFSTEVQKQSKSSEYEEAYITFTLNSQYFRLTEGNNTKVVKRVDLTSEETIANGIATDNITFLIKLVEENITSNIKEIKLFNSISIQMIDVDGNYETKVIEVPDESLPRVNVYQYNQSLVN